MDLSDFALCPKCNAVMKTNECLNCGHNVVIEKKKKKDEKVETEIPSVTEPIVEKKEVKSIFEQLVAADYDLLRSDSDIQSPLADTPKRSIAKYVVLATILILFLVVSGFGAFDLYARKLDYKIPATIATNSEDKTVDEIAANIKSSNSEGIERTIELETDLKEGNFDKLDFSVFAAPDTNMLIEMFDFKHFLKNIAKKEDLYNQLKKDFSFNDDDFEVYFEKSFAIIFPQNDFDKWGIVLASNDEKFITERMATYTKLAADKKTIYPQYSVETRKVNDETYILISNSKVYLDQMKESSEGELQNLGKDALYVDSLADMPKLGSMLIFKKPETRTWSYVIEWAVKMYPEYVGFDKMLETMDSRFISIYSKDNKTKFVLSN